MTAFFATFTLYAVWGFTQLVYFTPQPKSDQDYVWQGIAPLTILVGSVVVALIASAVVGILKVLWRLLRSRLIHSHQ